MTDIIICIIPKINPDAPTVGPAVLKSHLMNAGFSCDVMDLNIRLYNSLKAINKHDHYFFDNDGLFTTNHHDLDVGNNLIYFSQEFIDFYKENSHIFMEWIDDFKTRNPTWIGLSILSMYSNSVAIQLSILIRQHLPNTKIVWGGAQIENGIEKFKNLGILDHYISGDGEFSIVELLKGNLTSKGIDSLEPNQVLDLNSVMLPNYDDIKWDDYEPLDYNNLVYITGSRGCVKRCTFCNVYQIWPEYRFRTGRHIADEIIAVRQKYNRQFFKFTDSLINGSMKSFRSLLTELADYHKLDSNFRWASQWIVRSKSQSPESDYQLMADSGCSKLEIGIESFSQHVRYHMGKKFTDDDMWWCFEMLQQYKIAHTLLMIVGYPTETEDDHTHTLNTIQRLYDLGYADTVNADGHKLLQLSFGNTLMLSDDQPLWEQIKDDLTNFKNSFEWDYKDNTLAVRARRFKEINELIQQLDNKPNSGWLIDKELRRYDGVLNDQQYRTTL